MSSSSTTSSEDSFMEENLFMNDMNEFNMAAEKFSGQCILFVRKHRYYLGNNFEKYYNQLEALLKCLHILHCLKWRTRGDIVLRYSSSHVLTNPEYTEPEFFLWNLLRVLVFFEESNKIKKWQYTCHFYRKAIFFKNKNK